MTYLPPVPIRPAVQLPISGWEAAWRGIRSRCPRCGDAHLFARFLKPLVESGCKVTLVTHRRLFALLRTLGIPLELRPMGTPGSVAGIAAWTPLLSLPLAMALGPHGLAAPAPYLAADAERIRRPRSRRPTERSTRPSARDATARGCSAS